MSLFIICVYALAMFSDFASSFLSILTVAQENTQPDDEGLHLDGLGDTVEVTTEAATEFASWVTSGQRDALLAIAIIILTVGALILFRNALTQLVRRGKRSDDNSLLAILERVIRRFRLYFMIAMGLAAASIAVAFPETVQAGVEIICIFAVTLQFAEWAQEAAVSSIRRSAGRAHGDTTMLVSAVNIIKWFVSLAIWSVAALLILDNLNMDVTALLAGLGIGGLAIGLAAQGIFRDLFSAMSIILDKPFLVGDTVRYGDTWADIEDIGLKTTRLRSKNGEQIIISNTNLLETEIRNMSRMTRRRIELGFGVVYQTPHEVAEKIPGMVAAMIKDLQTVEFDRCSMSGFGPSSLDYELVIYSLNADFNRSMAAKSKILLALFKLFGEEGIEFAYPTQTLFIEGTGAETALSDSDVRLSVVGKDSV